jgi:hypothetical protein
MYTYVTKELPKVLSEHFPTLDQSRMGITGIHMGIRCLFLYIDGSKYIILYLCLCVCVDVYVYRYIWTFPILDQSRILQAWMYMYRCTIICIYISLWIYIFIHIYEYEYIWTFSYCISEEGGGGVEMSHRGEFICIYVHNYM